jgi:8-oxo-dGTP diphosphatase
MLESNILHVVAAIIVRDSEVLACRRASHKAAAGQWEFPGGKVDPGETSQAALIREIWEELSLDCAPIKTFDISDTLVGKQIIRLETILCKIQTISQLKSTDHDQFLWLKKQEITKLDWAKPDLPAVAKLSDGIEFSDLLN